MKVNIDLSAVGCIVFQMCCSLLQFCWECFATLMTYPCGQLVMCVIAGGSCWRQRCLRTSGKGSYGSAGLFLHLSTKLPAGKHYLPSCKWSELRPKRQKKCVCWWSHILEKNLPTSKTIGGSGVYFFYFRS